MNWFHLIIFISLFQAKPFTVIYIDGRAFLNRNNNITELKPGSAVYPEDKVRFENKKGSIRLAGKGGTFQLSSEKGLVTTNESSGLWASIAKAVLPTVVSAEMKARGGPISSVIEAEKAFREFQTNARPMLVLDTLLMPVSPAFIKDTSAAFFYLAYQKDGETINKRIPFKSEEKMLNLCFDERLLLIDGRKKAEDSISDAKIYFYEPASKKSVFISPFNIRIKAFKSMRQELCLIVNAVVTDQGNKLETDNAIKQTLTYLRAYYGNLDEELYTKKYFFRLDCNKIK